MKRTIKDILGRLVFSTGLYRLFIRNKAIIVLFHRVDDRLKGDPISCTATEFRNFCLFFRRYFKIVTLRELLDRLRTGKDIGRCMAITFDDGYKDNFLRAAPELERLGLPACFFVATNLIASSTIPWWDEKLPMRLEWMTWDEVRDLRSRGFEIGSHTMNHVDLGIVDGDEAVTEIVGSRERLSRELNEKIELFTYPYGRIKQITEENRQRVRAAGYSCCMSAYGGAVAPETDPFLIKRAPISPWYTSPYQFGFEALFFDP